MGIMKFMFYVSPHIILSIMSAEDPISSCQLVGFAGILIQVILGALSFSVLIYKRYREKPKRAWKIWALDTSKQGVSQILAHIINVLISMLLSTRLDSDACIWYLTTNILDNTVGVFLCIGVLTLIEKYVLGQKYNRFQSGNYYSVLDEYQEQKTFGGNIKVQGQNHYHTLEITQRKTRYAISYFDWTIQFIVWNVIVVLSKTLLFFTEMLLSSPITSMAQFLIGWIQPYQTLQLILVIIVVPVIMNGLAFWIQDNFLKKKEIVPQKTQSQYISEEKHANKQRQTESTAGQSDAPPVEINQPLL